MGILDWISLIKNLGSKIFKPSNNLEFNSPEVRQSSLFSKDNKTVIINVPTKNEFYIADWEKIPPDIKSKIVKQFTSNRPEDKSDNKIEFLNNQFEPRAKNYIKHYYEEDELLKKILPFIEPKFKSILKLSSYVKKLFDEETRSEAQRIKTEIGHTYGKEGRRLVNLFTTGYITLMIREYIDKIFDSAQDPTQIGVRLNDLIRKVIKNSEYIFFIHGESNVEEIATKIIGGMAMKHPYIALHSAGATNIAIAQEILEKIGRDEFSQYGYTVRQENPKSTSLCPFFDVYIEPAGAIAKNLIEALSK